jgi:hypothetical protein
MGNRSVWIDKITGKLATENTPIEAREERVITDVQDILYWVNKSNPRGPIPSNPASDPQFLLWNEGVQKWWEQNKYRYNVTTEADLPAEYENIHTNNNKPVLQINGLPSEINLLDKPIISIINQNQFPLSSVDIFINDNYITTLSNPFRFMFNPKDYGFLPGVYKLKVVATNTIFAVGQKEQSFTITQ